MIIFDCVGDADACTPAKSLLRMRQQIVPSTSCVRRTPSPILRDAMQLRGLRNRAAEAIGCADRWGQTRTLLLRQTRTSPNCDSRMRGVSAPTYSKQELGCSSL